MAAHTGDKSALPAFYLLIEALHHHFAKALGGAHHIGGVDSFVRRNEHKALTAVFDGGKCGLICTEYIVFH